METTKRMQKIIKKAIKGGYKNRPALRYINAYMPINEDTMNIDCILTDPLFWQSLGKACGWEGNVWYEFSFPNKSNFRQEEIPTWQYHAMRFHYTNLTEGFDKAIQYLSDLIESN